MKFFEYCATKVWFENDAIYVQTKDGNSSSLPLASFPILYNASPALREEVQIIDGYALYWPTLGEDLSVEGFFVNKKSTMPI